MNAISENFGWIEIVVFAAVALGFGLWQLRSVNQEIAKDKEAAESAKRPNDDGGPAL